MSYTCKDHGDYACDGCHHNPFGNPNIKQLPKCAHGWIGRDAKDHVCISNEGHAGPCKCDCGARTAKAVINPLVIKPYYKRKKVVR